MDINESLWGEFEKVLKRLRSTHHLWGQQTAILERELIYAHNEDIAKKDRQISELIAEASNDAYIIDNLNFQKAEKDILISELRSSIGEIKAHVPVLGGNPDFATEYVCPCGEAEGIYRTDNYCYKCGAKLLWEYV